jgi:hypothetical protein
MLCHMLTDGLLNQPEQPKPSQFMIRNAKLLMLANQLHKVAKVSCSYTVKMVEFVSAIATETIHSHPLADIQLFQKGKSQ